MTCEVIWNEEFFSFFENFCASHVKLENTRSRKEKKKNREEEEEVLT